MSNSDPQAQRVYAWERAHVEPKDSGILRTDEVRALISRESIRHGINSPRVMVKQSNGHCRAFPARNEIHITQWGRTRTTVLHELAHIIDYQLTKGRSGMGHGPIFVGIAMTLYSRYIGIPMHTLQATAAGMGIRFVNLA